MNLRPAIKHNIYRILLWCWKINPFKRQTAFCLRSLKLPLNKFYVDLRFKGECEINIEDRKIYLFSYLSTLENNIFWNGIENGWEKVSLKYWRRLCKKSSVIMDIGANTGLYVLVAKKLNPESTVYCFEPSISTYKKLKRNIEENKLEIYAYQVAISDKNDRSTFYDFNSVHQYNASLNKEFTNESDPLTYDVTTKTFSSFIEENQIQRVDLMKIDVKSYESKALKGMSYYLEKFRPVLLVEILNDEAGKKIEQLLPMNV